MPIKGLSEQVRMQRTGKIRLGIKAPNKSGNGEHPVAVEYFVVPPEVARIYGDKPTQLSIIIPSENDEEWCPQYYKCYSMTRGLICKGDGETCRRLVDTVTGALASRDTKDAMWKLDIPCKGQECPDYQAKQCREVMNLTFILPDFPDLGVWQVDTSSVNSIMNINSAAKLIRAACKRISFMPLTLTIEPKEVVNPEDHKKKTVRVLNLHIRKSFIEVLQEAQRPMTELLLPPPDESEPVPEEETTIIQEKTDTETKTEPESEIPGITEDEIPWDVQRELQDGPVTTEQLKRLNELKETYSLQNIARDLGINVRSAKQLTRVQADMIINNTGPGDTKTTEQVVHEAMKTGTPFIAPAQSKMEHIPCKNLGDFFGCCFNEFHGMMKKQAIAEAGFNRQEEIADCEAAYQAVKAKQSGK